MLDITAYEEMLKIKLSESDREWIAENTAKFLNDFSKLDNVDAEKVQPLITVLDIGGALREDKAVVMISRDELLRGAPDSEAGYFSVPKTLD